MFDFSAWTNDHTLSLITIVFVVFGGYFAYIQWRDSIDMQRAKFMEQIIEKLRFDKDMAKALYIVDYTQNWYNEKFHGGTHEEFLIDKLLSYLTYVCYLLETKHIGKDETKILAYELSRVCASWSMRAYLWNLNNFSEAQNTTCTFKYFIDYGIKHGLLCKTDFSGNCEKYPKYLNF